LEVVVEIREPELPALLADFLGQGHEHAQPGTVDVSRLAEIDQELFLATLELVEHLLLELLAVAHDELPLHIHHDNFSLLPECEAHVSVSRRNSRASSGRASTAIPASPESSDCNAVIAATLIMSSVEAPRERSEHGRARPCTMGPIARACANRSTSLYAMFPASSDGNTSTFARPATALPGAFVAATAATSAASPCNSPSTANRTPRARIIDAASRTRSTDGPVPLPSVLYERSATRGSSPTMRMRSRAAAIAMSANCSAVGRGTTAQSVNVSTSGTAGSLALGAGAPRNGGTTM